jgi:hypothetical protein
MDKRYECIKGIAGRPIPGEPRVMDNPQLVTHDQVVRWWRQGRATTVSARIIEYVNCDNVWWRRLGSVWEQIPDGPFALSLSAGRERYEQACCAAGVSARAVPGTGVRDPWASARNRRRGGACGRPEVFMPMSATEVRPRHPITCPTRARG